LKSSITTENNEHRNTMKKKTDNDLLGPVHPGEILWEDFMKPLGLSQYRVAQDIGVAPIRISEIVRGKRAITPDTAMRLGRYFGTSAMIWMRLQAQYDLEVAEIERGDRILGEVSKLAMAK
jgi:addiction module HigA family antidote